MKAYRISYYAIMALCLLGGMINGIRAYYLIFFFQLFLVAISFALNCWTIFSFAYIQKLDERRAVKGGQCTLHVGIYNDKPFPFTMMRVHVGMVAHGQEEILTINLMPRESIDFDLPVELPYRGEYQIGMTILEITDIFGLMPMKIDMRRLSYYRQIPLLIYPHLAHLSALAPRAGDEKRFAGVHLAASPQGDSFAQVRDYLPGDSARRIHWKLFARKRALYTKQYEIPSEAETILLLGNTVHTGEAALRYADVVCECAGALAYYALKRSYPVRLIEGNPRRKPVTALTMGGFQPLYDWLARLPFDASQQDLSQILDAQVRAQSQVRSIYVLADRLDHDLFAVLERAIAGGREVTCVFVEPNEKQPVMPDGARVLSVYYGQDIHKALENFV